MSVINRTLDSSAKRFPLVFSVNGSQTNGETGILSQIPFPCVLEAAQLAAFNPTPQVFMMLTLSRFVVGQGMTTWVLGSTFAPVAFGTSGVLASGISLPSSSGSSVGSTLCTFMANDVIGYQIGGGATAAIFGIAGNLIVKPLQDLKVFINTL